MDSKNNIFTTSLLLLTLLSTLQHSTALNSTTDEDSLLHFKSYITDDPNGILNSWTTNTSFCNWTGITCNPTKQRVTEIYLPSLGLSGPLSPHIANLSFLQVLDLENNSFSGTLPIEFGQLFRLQNLVLAYNLLTGTIPSSLSLCTELQILDLSDNKFEGFIPPQLSKLPVIEVLSLANNILTGPIPASFGNTSSLTNLILMTNHLYGSIPVELGHLSKLKNLQIATNNITGDIPPSLFNASSLVFLTVTENRLTGGLPSDMFSRLPNLKRVLMGVNNLTGHIPASLSNASVLELFDIANNSFSGQVPWLGNLVNLQRFNLEFNQLVSDGDGGLDFIISLSNSTNLKIFSVANNLLTGRLPSISNLSTHLTMLAIGGNQLEGSLPAEIGRFVNLTMLAMEGNSISGNIPPTIGNLKNLEKLLLQGNALTGPIPESVGNLSALSELNLNQNSLTSFIPSSMANCERLQILDLSANTLNGTLPKEIFTIPSLSIVLNLSHNSLSGPVPDEIGKLRNLQKIDISGNQLSGRIPDEVGNCVSLQELNMAGNSFEGPIPVSIGNLKGIESIDLSSNSLSGSIPSSLQTLELLHSLNLSMNLLQGEVPKEGVFTNATVVSLVGNPELCGGEPNLDLPNCTSSEGHSSRSKVKLIVGLSIGGAVLCILLVFFLLLSHKRKRRELPVTNVISFEGPHTLYTYYDLRTATDNFSTENLIGEGSFGSVYKGVLRDGTTVAIKVFKMEQEGVSKSFLAECEAMRNIRHRNLVRIISVCSSSVFKALVLQFMSNGSVEKWLHEMTESKGEKRSLDVRQRLEIAIDVASALEYLHHDCEYPVIHCDLKPSNILLGDDKTAHVGDFGLAKMLLRNPDDHHLSTTFELNGSIGYIPPEYGLCRGVSPKGDVYGYGILLLELFTRKRPTDEMFTGELTLKKWVSMALPDRVTDVLDPEMKDMEQAKDCLVSVLQLGLFCTVESPEGRPTMRDVSVMIKAAKDELLWD